MDRWMNRTPRRYRYQSIVTAIHTYNHTYNHTNIHAYIHTTIQPYIHTTIYACSSYQSIVLPLRRGGVPVFSRAMGKRNLQQIKHVMWVSMKNRRWT